MNLLKATRPVAFVPAILLATSSVAHADATPTVSTDASIESQIAAETLADVTSEVLSEVTDTFEIELGDPSEQGVVVGDNSLGDLLFLDDDSEAFVAVGLPVDGDVEPRVTVDGDVVFESTNEGAEVLVQELDVTDEPLLQSAARAVFTIDSYDVDPRFTMDVDVAGASEIVENEDGSVTVADANGDILAYLGAPWAVDADGTSVNTWYEIDGDTVHQYVDHLAREYAYPIIADPPFLIPVLLVGGRIVVQRVVAASAAAASRSAVTAVARSGASVVGRANLRSFTSSNYRHNLIVWSTRNPGTRCDAHHTLPQAFRTKFVASGFTGSDTIDHPRYLVWWERNDHRAKSAAVNNSWRAWWGSKARDSKARILDKRTAVLRQYPPRC